MRERLVDHLIACGAELVHDFKPYCIKFKRRGQLIEITYQNVKQRPISEIVEGFDIACCAIAAIVWVGTLGAVLGPLLARAGEAVDQGATIRAAAGDTVDRYRQRFHPGCPGRENRGARSESG